jgi:hypothetical protein
MEDLGWRFWAKLAGFFVLGAIALFVIGFFFLSAIYEWGLFGTFLAVALVVLVIGWIFDRRQAKRRASY